MICSGQVLSPLCKWKNQLFCDYLEGGTGYYFFPLMADNKMAHLVPALNGFILVNVGVFPVVQHH